MLNRVMHNQIRRACCSIGQTVLYEVSIKFKNIGIRDDYMHWLSCHHIDEVLKFEGFLSATLFTDTNNEGLVVHYILESPNAFNSYDRSAFAKRLREEAAAKFDPEAFVVTRRLLVPQNQFFR